MSQARFPVMPCTRAGTLILLLTCAAPAEALASGDECGLQTWLSEAAMRGTALSAAHTGAELLRASTELADLLSAYPADALARDMHASGLGKHVPTVLAFVSNQRAQLDLLSTGKTVSLPLQGAELGPMKALAEGLSCAADPDWRPGVTRTTIPSEGWVSQGNTRLAKGPTGMILTAVALLTGALAISTGRIVGRYARRATRERCAIYAVLKTDGAEHPCTALDISPYGARLDARPGVPDKVRGTVRLGGQTLRCRVIWSNEESVGLAFRRRMGKAAFRRMLASHQWEAAPVPTSEQGALPENEERRPKGAAPQPA